MEQKEEREERERQSTTHPPTLALVHIPSSRTISLGKPSPTPSTVEDKKRINPPPFFPPPRRPVVE